MEGHFSKNGCPFYVYVFLNVTQNQLIAMKILQMNRVKKTNKNNKINEKNKKRNKLYVFLKKYML